ISTLKDILSSGNTKEFITLVESEALTLHAMMMSSNPYFILMKPNTVEIINKIWEYRAETESSLCFTLDAGANVHCLYSESESEEVEKFISNELSQYCENQMYIIDEIGSGASRL
ncbi:MAG: diphosphomevalonate decarboxylase, partial [Flavobacteriaceae bacterium]|nr:diphosphomevalonate decarboxylase [Flavobacteriaceae bacterium]